MLKFKTGQNYSSEAKSLLAGNFQISSIKVSMQSNEAKKSRRLRLFSTTFAVVSGVNFFSIDKVLVRHLIYSSAIFCTTTSKVIRANFLPFPQWLSTLSLILNLWNALPTNESNEITFPMLNWQFKVVIISSEISASAIVLS